MKNKLLILLISISFFTGIIVSIFWDYIYYSISFIYTSIWGILFFVNHQIDNN